MFARQFFRNFSSSSALKSQVTVVGSAGGIGQPLSLLLKLNPRVSALKLYDVAPFNPGVAVDISHCNTPAKTTGYAGDAQLGDSLSGSDVVVIPAGVPRKPGMTRDDLFNTNASIVAGIAQACAKHCPQAKLLIISNPVNSTVPIAAEVLKAAGAYDPARLFGVTTLDVVRARTFLSEATNEDPRNYNITVVGGHAGITIMPLLSQSSAKSLDAEQVAALTKRIQFGGDEVVMAKDGAGSATLSMAMAGAEFTDRVLAAQQGESSVVECSYVAQPGNEDGLSFFSCPVTLGANGVEKIHRDLGPLSSFEQEMYEKAVPELQGSIKKGIEFAQQFLKK